MAREAFDIDSMPRGGPDASWLDRRLQTNRLPYLDRDGGDKLKRRVIRSLDRNARILGTHKKIARIALNEVAEVANPKILELGSGHGGLSRTLLKMHPTAQVTVTDIQPQLLAAIASSELGRHPRAVVREMDATAIDAPDRYYDLAVFALSFHQLPPSLASRTFAEGTRAAAKLLIIDLSRPPSLLHILRLAWQLPFAPVAPVVHDGFISSLRAYSPSALRALARHADPAITVELRRGALRNPMAPQIVLASRLRSRQ